MRRRSNSRYYLETATRLGLRKIIEGICSIVRKTDSHQKYHHLMSALARPGYVKMPDDLRAFLSPVKPGLGERLKQIEPLGNDSTIEVWFVQPTASDDDVRASTSLASPNSWSATSTR